MAYQAIKPLHENKYVSFWIENGVLVQFFKKEATTVSLRVAQQVVKDRKLVSANVPMLLLSDMGYVRAVDVDAMEYFVSEEGTSDVRSLALYLHNYLQYTLANIFLLYYQRQIPFPAKIVRTTQEGIQWLLHEAGV